MTNDEKYELAMNGARAVKAIAESIVKMADATLTYKRQDDADLDGRGLDGVLMMLTPYVLSLDESEQGLGDVRGDREFINKVAEDYYKLTST